MDLQAKINAYSGWRHKMELAPGVFTPGEHDPAAKLAKLRLPADLTGKRVLDIGASDGFFSFECERRGAQVTAMDVRAPHGFGIAKAALGSQVRYVQGSLYDEDLGQFDLVLCLNVLYHVKEVYLAVERLRQYCAGEIILLTTAMDGAFYRDDGSSVPLAEIAPDLKDASLVQFLPSVGPWKAKAAGGSYPSYWHLSARATTDIMEAVGFTIDDTQLTGSSRLFVWAHV